MSSRKKFRMAPSQSGRRVAGVWTFFCQGDEFYAGSKDPILSLVTKISFHSGGNWQMQVGQSVIRFTPTVTVVDQWSRQSPLLEAAQRCSGRRSPSCSTGCRGGPDAPLDHGGPWDRVHVAGAGGLGLPSGHPTRLHPAGQADGERAHRVIQRPVARRVPQRAAILLPGRCAAKIEAWRIDYNHQRPTAPSGT